MQESGGAPGSGRRPPRSHRSPTPLPTWCRCRRLPLSAHPGCSLVRDPCHDARHYGRKSAHREESEEMSTARPKALVTAAVSGPGLDLLGELADLVLDSWLDQPQLRIYT